MTEDKKDLTVALQTGFVADNFAYMVDLRDMHVMFSLRAEVQANIMAKDFESRDVALKDLLKLAQYRAESDLHHKTVGLLNTITGTTPNENVMREITTMLGINRGN